MIETGDARQPSVLASVSLGGEELKRSEFTWAWDDEPHGEPENLQRWTGSDVRLYSRTVRSTAPLEKLVVDDITGELLIRAMDAGWSKAAMRALLKSAEEIRPEPVDVALIINGQPVPGATASLVNALGSIVATAGRSDGDVAVVVHDADPGQQVSVSLPGTVIN